MEITVNLSNLLSNFGGIKMNFKKTVAAVLGNVGKLAFRVRR